MVLDAVTYLVLIGGLIGIGLGSFGLLRNRLSGWHGLFPSALRYDHSLRLMEEALADIDHDAGDQEAEAFRSFFATEPEEPQASRGRAFPESTATADYEDLDDEEEEVVVRPPIRRFSANSAAEPLPRVARLMRPGEMIPPLPQEEDQPAEEAAEDEDVLSDILVDESTADGLDDDLLSLFEETEIASKVPEAVRNMVPRVSMSELLAEAREVWGLVGARVGPDEDAA